MASVPVTQPVETLEEKFSRLAAKWREETGFLSSSTDMVAHPAYQEIIGLGQAVVPLLLRDLERRPTHWFWALHAITGANPVPLSDSGRLPKMAEHWLRWGKASGYKW